MRQITINQNDCGQRLDKFLSKFMPYLPTSMLYKGVRKNCVRINGKHVKDASVKLAYGDVLSLYFKDEFFQKPDEATAYKTIIPNLSIIYEDDNILLIDKKPGMVVHADETGTHNTLIANVQAYLYKKGEWRPDTEQSFVPSLCNRIDRNTGGIVIAAKNAESLRIMNEKIKNREITKLYLCVVVGVLDKKEATLHGHLFKDEKKKQVYVYDTPQKGTKSISTKYRVLAENDGVSLVEVDLLTGRTHQIRAHFASIGHPLLGDGKYGNNQTNKDAGRLYQALYSYKLSFDFTEDGGVLSYLNGQTFTVPDVEFTSSFGYQIK